MIEAVLYHFTCDHGHDALGDDGILLPLATRLDNNPVLFWPARFVWMTDLTLPNREGLGLTSHILRCDRTRFRYRVTDNRDIFRWSVAARGYTREQRDALEAEPGARPAHWYVSESPIPVVFDPC